MNARKWTLRFVTITPLLMGLTLTLNLVVDPYSITPYNLLGIPNKFARDDRVEKVNHLQQAPRYALLLLGSSRVYGINPLFAQRLTGLRSYNAGVGTARIEDQLGFLLFLERIDKFPNTILLGLDFYTFNPALETNSYFLRNHELNFLHARTGSQDYLAKFISVDALGATYKTLVNFILNPEAKPRFNVYGSRTGSETNFALPQTSNTNDTRFSSEKITREMRFITTTAFSELSAVRLRYLERTVALAQKHHARLILFITPLASQLQDAIDRDPVLRLRLAEFKAALNSIAPYYDFATHSAINATAAHFTNPTHTTAQTGNLMLARMLDPGTVSDFELFGVYRTP